MPKIDGLPGRRQNTTRERWKLCALESHWHVRNVNSVITTRRRIRRIIRTEWKLRNIADSAGNTQCTRRRNKSTERKVTRWERL